MDFELKHGFKYHTKANGGNEEVEAKFIKISAFSMKQMDKVAPVKEIVMKALGKLVESIDISAEDAEAAKVAREQAKEEAENVDSGEMMTIIAMHCGEGDLLKLHLYMRKLLSCGVAYIDAEVKLIDTWIDKMNPADFDALCGEYIGNFITS